MVEEWIYDKLRVQYDHYYHHQNQQKSTKKILALRKCYRHLPNTENMERLGG